MSSASPSSPDANAFLRVRNVTKTYRRGRTPVHALQNVSLTLPRGTFVGVAGPSGSGKSTLLHVLAALDRPSTGTIEVGEWRLGELAPARRSQYRRSMVGLVFQQFHLVPTMTARENVALPLLLAGIPPAERKQRAASVLDRVGLADRLEHRPAALSGGEQQRVAAARALVGDPPLLLADEPTGNLDADTGAAIIDLLTRVHRTENRTVIVATHHSAEIEPVADQILHLQDGRLAESA